MHDIPPILEFDPERQAIIEPTVTVKRRDLPERCVLCFFRDVIDKVSDELCAEALPPFKSEMGLIPVYAAGRGERRFAFAQCPVGAPLAAAVLEELIARGGRFFVGCGSCGVLDSSIGSGELILPTVAVRDEGTSYHYLPPGRDVTASPRVVERLAALMGDRGLRYVDGKTWTTDAFFRETRGRIARRREEGCVAVEMEAAALFAVAQFRDVDIGMALYGSDDVAGDEWDRRDLGRRIPTRESLFRLCIEACLGL